MPYYQSCFTVSPAAQEVSDLLFEQIQALGTWTETLDIDDATWETATVEETDRVHAFCRSDQAIEQFRAWLQSQVAAFNAHFDTDIQVISVEEVTEENWAVRWKEGFPPRDIGARLLICAPWNAERRPDRYTMIIEPGLAFGTGLHETTQHAAELLEQQVVPGMTVLDLGSGSGVLSMAARLLGAARVVGLEVEEAALREAGENAARTGLDGIAFFHPDQAEHAAQYDLLVANMLWKEHVVAVPPVWNLLTPTAPVILGGIGHDLVPVASGWLAERGYRVVDTRRGELFTALTALPESSPVG